MSYTQSYLAFMAANLAWVLSLNSWAFWFEIALLSFKEDYLTKVSTNAS